MTGDGEAFRQNRFVLFEKIPWDKISANQGERAVREPELNLAAI